MALEKIAGGLIVDSEEDRYLGRAAGLNLHAVLQQVTAASAKALELLKTKADILALDAARAATRVAQATALDALSAAGAASSLAGAAHTVATNAADLATNLASAAGFGPSTPTDGTIATYVGQSSSQAARAVDARARARTRTVYPEDFGAVGDGLADDTAALEAWLASPSKSLSMGAGRYRVVRPLASSVAGRTIWSEGGWIVSAAKEDVALDVTGPNTRVRIGVDCTETARIGLRFRAGGGDASGSEVRGAKSTTNAAGGIWAETAFGFRCVGAKVDGITSVGDTTIGNGNGASRGIYLGGSGIVASAPSLIESCEVSNIRGEEGDAIQVLATAPAGQPFGSMLCTVRGNSIRGFSRRAIKVQASDVAVVDNECVDLDQTVTGSEHAVIYVINQNGAVVVGNRVDVARFSYGVHVANSGTVPYAERTVVSGNIVNVGPSATMAIYISGVTGAVITGNRSSGGQVGTNVVRALDSTILDNVGAKSPRPMVLFEPLTGSTVKRNTVAGAGTVEASAATLYSWAEASPYGATSVPTNVRTTIPWGAMAAPWVTMVDGRLTLSPGRYHVEVNVAGTPANPAGDTVLTLWQKSRAGGVVRVTRIPVSAAGRIVSWGLSATIVVGPAGDEVWTTLYQNSGSDLPLISDAGYPYFRIDRLD